MTAAAQEAPTPAARSQPLWRRIVLWALIVFVIAAAANLLGWDIRGWFHEPLEDDHDDLGRAR